MQKRYIFDQVWGDLKEKMVFVAGPRQVGKTTMAKVLLEKHNGSYLNWDVSSHREAILNQRWPTANFWVFDEIHKFRGWRNLLKGLYDYYGKEVKILVIGSAKLDTYRYGGDSLQGRYHFLRLYPLTADELHINSKSELMKLFESSPFPEPYFAQKKDYSRRWSREYRQKLLNEDINSLENVSDLAKIELLYIRLPELVGSPLSLNSLREDLQVSHKTVQNWVNILEKNYAIYRISPYTQKNFRGLKKEQKHYCLDWNLVGDKGARFENMVANHLIKRIHFLQDTKGADLDLKYFRDVDGREVDFVVTLNNKPIWAVECKSSEKDVSKSLKYIVERISGIKGIQVVLDLENGYRSGEITVLPAIDFLTKKILELDEL